MNTKENKIIQQQEQENKSHQTKKEKKRIKTILK